MSYYRQQLEDWLKTIDVKADCVMDIGGEQGNVSGRVKSWQVFDYEVLDLPEFDVQNVSSAIHLSKFKQADIIFCLEVFEYLIKPHKALKSIKILLKPGGKAYVTFAFAYPHHNELEMDSLRYTEPGIRQLAKLAGLTINHIWYRIDRSGKLQEFYREDGMHPAKQYAHHNVTGFIVEFTK